MTPTTPSEYQGTDNHTTAELPHGLEVGDVAATSRVDGSDSPIPHQVWQLIADALARNGRDEPLAPHTDLRDAGLDSLATIDLISGLEDEYDLMLPDSLLEAGTFATPQALWAALRTLPGLEEERDVDQATGDASCSDPEAGDAGTGNPGCQAAVGHRREDWRTL